MTTLNDQVKELQERAHRQDLRYAEERISKAEHDARLSEDLLAKAVAECNGDDVARALRSRDEALDRIRQAVADRRALEESEPKSVCQSPLAALKLDNALNFTPVFDFRPQSYEGSHSVNDLLDKAGIAQFLAHRWFEKNEWFATAHPTQRKIVESLHATLRAQNMGVHQSAYWDSLSGLIAHLKLDSFTLPQEVAPVSIQERILLIMQGLVETIASARDDDAPTKKKSARVRKKVKSVTPAPAATVV